MRIQYTITLCLILCAGASLGRAQVASPSSPFDLAVTNVSIASVRVRTNNVVAFEFADARFGVDKVDELDKELDKNGIHSKRLIRFMEGANVVAEGRLYGRVWGVHDNGFLLHFDSSEAARKAARVMWDKGTFVLPKTFEGDTKAWTIY
jgi:hypothetical protein